MRVSFSYNGNLLRVTIGKLLVYVWRYGTPMLPRIEFWYN